MIIIGAITRLSESGLSMVEWRPLIGALPPMNEEEWKRIFNLYKESPEFQKKNFWMSVADFKYIFFWEWFHRFWGRMIGIIYMLPFTFFLLKGWIPKTYKLKFFGLLLLGGAQGAMGWYMVKSGLVDIPTVSHYRLAAHLFLAFLIIALMLWLGMTLRKAASGRAENPDSALFKHGLICLGALVATIFWGAYTAGLDAGLVYNDSYPKMGATWIPEEVWFYKPVWLNFFENHAGVQFMHRWLAFITLLLVLSFSAHAIRKRRTDICFALISIMVLMQFALGIITLFSHVALPIATLHQAGAVILLGLLILCLHDVKYRKIDAFN